MGLLMEWAGAPNSLSTTFLKNCGRGESPLTSTCVKTVVGGKQGHASCEIL